MPRPVAILAALLLASCGSEAHPAAQEPAPSSDPGASSGPTGTQAPSPEPAPTPAPAAGGPALALDGRAAIVPEDRAQDVTACYGMHRYEGYWSPAAADLSRLEEALSAALTDQHIERPLSGYHMHVAGVVLEGRRLLLIGAFCHATSGADWVNNPMCVDDGGDCYFEAEVDPATGEVARFSPHGDA